MLAQRLRGIACRSRDGNSGLALAALPSAAVLARTESLFGAPAPSPVSEALSAFGGASAQAKPNSLFNGVQIGTITYSYRSMPDQSAEATLKYILDSGISAIELMGGPAESFAGAPSAGPRRWCRARRGRPRPGGAAAAAGGGRRGGRRPVDPATPGAKMGSGTAAMLRDPAAGGARGGRRHRAAGGGGGRGRAEQTPEQQAAQQEAAAKLKAWRTSVSMDKFKSLRKMYNDAGVTIYAWKQLSPNMSDEEFEYVFNVAEALGCTHTTLELPTDDAQLKRIGDFAMKKKIYAAYHTHAQGSMTAFDKAFAVSKGNMANVDFGHWVAAGNVGGTPMEFLDEVPRSDRELPSQGSHHAGALRAESGVGHRRNADQRDPPDGAEEQVEDAGIDRAGIQIPEGSDAVKETRKCVEFCRTALTGGSSTTASR